MGLIATPGASFVATADGFVSGLVGTIGIEILTPGGTVVLARTTAGITQPVGGVGFYSATSTAPLTIGEYVILWDDGSGNDATEDLTVNPFLPTGLDLCTLADVRLAQRLPDGEDTDQDDLRETNITDASQTIERWCARELSDRGTLTRTFAYRGLRSLPLAPYDLRSVSSLDVDGTVLTQNADFYLEPLPSQDGTFQRIDFEGYPISQVRSLYWRSRPRRVVTITGAWGMAAVPVDVKRAAVETVKAWMDRGSPDTYDSSDARMVGDSPSGFDIPWSARKLLANFRVRAGS